MKPTFPLLIAKAALLWLHVACINFEKGGYKDIQVAINHNIKEDRRIIENLKELFTNASELLYNATRGQAYFSEVIIIAPKNWTLKGMKFEPLYGGNYFDTADIRVDNPNPGVNSDDEHEPYTLQSGKCGEAGKYIHLTPDFVINVTSRIRWPTHFESVPVRILVHEWAHLRYGIFDEYGIPGDPKYPAFYTKGNKVYPATCIHGISGYNVSSDMGPCTITDGVVGRDCRFLPDMHNPTAKASLMSYHYVPTMEHFCEDDTSDSSLMHNKEAPSKQNEMCDRRSTWSVIKSHEDFKNVKQWPNVAHQSRVNIKPKFVLKKIEKEVSSIVLVLDVSSSMYSENRLKYLKESTIRFLMDRVPREYYVGIVIFSTNAELLTKRLHQIVDESSRRYLTSLISNLNVKVWTNIEDGMRKGLQLLKNGPTKTAEKGVIVLVSDGEENRGSRVRNVFKEIQDSKVFVVPIAFGSQASNTLEDMAKMTGCKSFFFSTAPGKQISTSKVDEAFEHALEKIAKEDVQMVNLVNTKKSISQRETRHLFTLDKGLSKKTTITIVSEYVRYLSVSLIDPKDNTKTYGSGSNPKEYNKDEQAKRILVRIAKATPGKWTIVLTSSTSIPFQVDIQVQSEAADPFNHQPIRVQSWLSSLEADLSSFAKGKGLRIFAEVKKGYNAVVDAKVIATVETPNNQVIDVTLKDNGKGADVSRNDGIYSAYFAMFPETGRYSVSARVINDGKAKIRLGRRGSGAVPLPDIKLLEELSKQRKPSVSFNLTEFNIGERKQDEDSEEDEDVFPSEQAEEFERTTSVGAFKVDQTWTPDVTKRIPPNKVTDLRVSFTHMSRSNLMATLRWTSPGDDMDFGNASWIELRGSTKMTDLLETNFIRAFHFDNIPELRKPLPPGSLQVLNVSVPVNLVKDHIGNFSNDGSGVVEAVIDFHFALRAHDKDNNMANVSNVATAHFSEIWDVPRNAKVQTTTPIPTTTETASTVTPTTTALPTTDEDISSTVISSESTPFDTTTDVTLFTPTTTPVPTTDEDVSSTVTSFKNTPFDTTTEVTLVTPTTTGVPTTDEDVSSTATSFESTPFDTTTEDTLVTDEDTLSTLNETSPPRIVSEKTTTESTLLQKPSVENKKSWMIFVWVCLGIGCSLSLAIIVWISIVQHLPRKHSKRRNTCMRKVDEEQPAANFPDQSPQKTYTHPLSLEASQRDTEYRRPFGKARLGSLPGVDRHWRKRSHAYPPDSDGFEIQQ